jgi:hypothetical protein
MFGGQRHSFKFLFCFIFADRMNASTSLHFVGFGIAYSGVDFRVAWDLFVLDLIYVA